jgi:prepilin-type N-terminal cleavage/methylation domain-containing protein
MKNNRAFTLIEVIVYIAIFAIMMTGAIGAVYALAGSDSRNQTKAQVQEEGSFLIGKIDWALSGAQSISSPGANASGNTLIVTNYNPSKSPIVIQVTGGNMTIAVGANPTHVLNNSNIQITCPAQGCFTHTKASADGINPENATSSLTISTNTSNGAVFSQFFSTVKYLRK